MDNNEVTAQKFKSVKLNTQAVSYEQGFSYKKVGDVSKRSVKHCMRRVNGKIFARILTRLAICFKTVACTKCNYKCYDKLKIIVV